MVSNKFLLIVLMAVLGALFSASSHAQQTKSSNRWEVGVDALSLFDKNTFVPYSLFGRYLLNPESDKKSHLRVRIGYDFFTYLDTAVRGNTFDHDSHRLAFMALLGYQREFSTWERSSLYWGAELSFSSDFRKVNWDLPNIQGFESLTWRFIGLHGLVGYTYHLTENISFSLESSVSISHRYYHTLEDVFFFRDDGSGISGRNGIDSSNRIDTAINPFHQILFTYKF
jgi:hypothetical protein